MTGDGRADVSLASGASGVDSGILVLPQRVNGTLGPIVAFDSARAPQPLVAADVNADGLEDLVTLHGGWSAGVFTQERDGTLSAERLFGIPNHGTYNRKALVVRDVSSDGRPDIVFAGETGVMVLRGEAPVPPTTTTTSTSTTVAPPTTTTTIPFPPPRIEPPDQSTSFQIDPAHSGTLTGGAERPPLAKRWSRDLGPDLSFPVIAAGRVFAVARTPFSRRSTLYAIEGVSGSDAWGPVDLGADATLGYGDGHVFTLNPDGILRSFDGADGSQRWIVRVARQTGFDLSPVYATASCTSTDRGRSSPSRPTPAGSCGNRTSATSPAHRRSPTTSSTAPPRASRSPPGPPGPGRGSGSTRTCAPGPGATVRRCWPVGCSGCGESAAAHPRRWTRRRDGAS